MVTALADTPAALKPRRRALPYPAVLTLLTGLLLLAALAGLALGSVRVPPGEVLAALTGSEPTPLAPVIWNVRLPRVLLAVVVGGGLAVAGTVLQALVRNPLADPFLLGASSGASTGRSSSSSRASAPACSAPSPCPSPPSPARWAPWSSSTRWPGAAAP